MERGYMAANWTRVTREAGSSLPTMLVQAIIVGAVLCIGELVCAPIYVGLSQRTLALVPWAFVACTLAVVFTYVVGFAVLWSVESLSGRMRERLVPLAYVGGGAVGFGAWSYFVFTALLNSVLDPLGLTVLSGGQQAAIGVNGAALGAAAFFMAAALAKPLSQFRTAVIAIGVVTVLFAAVGGFFIYAMYEQLY